LAFAFAFSPAKMPFERGAGTFLADAPNASTSIGEAEALLVPEAPEVDGLCSLPDWLVVPATHTYSGETLCAALEDFEVGDAPDGAVDAVLAQSTSAEARAACSQKRSFCCAQTAAGAAALLAHPLSPAAVPSPNWKAAGETKVNIEEIEAFLLASRVHDSAA